MNDTVCRLILSYAISNMLVMKGFLTPRGVQEADFLFWGDFLPRFGGGKPGKGSGFLHTDITKGLSRNDK